MPLRDDYAGEAFDFLRQSLEDYHVEKWKFSVLHGAMAIEQIIKAKLADIDPALVYTRTGSSHTVSLGQGLERLATKGVTLGHVAETLVRKVNDWRNGVAHSKGTFGAAEAEEGLGEIFKIFTTFAHDELDADIKDSLEVDQYHKFKELLKNWEEIATEAKAAAAAESYERKVGPRVHDCPDCWESGTTVVRNGKFYCHLCNESFDIEGCLRCGQPVSQVDPEDNSGTFCDSCAQYIAEQ